MTDLLREHDIPLRRAHSLRVYLFGAMWGPAVDHELLCFGAVFHDLGLAAKYRRIAGGAKWQDLSDTRHLSQGAGG